MAKRVRITNNVGGVFTPPLESRAVAELLLALYGGGHTEAETRAAIEAHHRLRDGQTVTHPRGFTLEPVELEESSDGL